MGDLHLVLPALNLSDPECWHFDNNATSKMVVAYEILVSAQGPLVFGFWFWGFGVWCLGLTIIKIDKPKSKPSPKSQRVKANAPGLWVSH